MANLFLRLSSSFARVQVKLVRWRKRETVFAHSVGGVHFEGARIGFLLKNKQKMKKDEPQKTKKWLRLSSSFWVRLSSFFAYTSIRNQFSPLQNGPLPQCERILFLFSFFPQVYLEHRQKTKKVEESGLPSLYCTPSFSSAETHIVKSMYFCLFT